MIVEGCDILLDVNQMFVRQGTLVQILPAGQKSAKNRITLGREKEREAVRQCFLFSNHLIVTSRTQGGKLHLVEGVGKVPLADITLIEDPTEENMLNDDQGKLMYLKKFLCICTQKSIYVFLMTNVFKTYYVNNFENKKAL